MKLRLFYRELNPELDDHPIDRLVYKRIGNIAHRKLAKLSSFITKALGTKSKLWLDYEQAQSHLYALREEMYFDLGVEHGLVSAGADELKENRRDVNDLAERLLREALSSGLPREDAAAAAVLVAWALLGRLRITKRRPS